jgi:hypothetical protein
LCRQLAARFLIGLLQCRLNVVARAEHDRLAIGHHHQLVDGGHERRAVRDDHHRRTTRLAGQQHASNAFSPASSRLALGSSSTIRRGRP